MVRTFFFDNKADYLNGGYHISELSGPSAFSVRTSLSSSAEPKVTHFSGNHGEVVALNWRNERFRANEKVYGLERVVCRSAGETRWDVGGAQWILRQPSSESLTVYCDSVKKREPIAVFKAYENPLLRPSKPATLVLDSSISDDQALIILLIILHYHVKENNTNDRFKSRVPAHNLPTITCAASWGGY